MVGSLLGLGQVLGQERQGLVGLWNGVNVEEVEVSLREMKMVCRIYQHLVQCLVNARQCLVRCLVLEVGVCLM